MCIKTTLSIVTAVTIFIPFVTFAHPGNTAADGCHYCRTNCAKWGEIEGARHCHNAKSVVTPTNTIQKAVAPKVVDECSTAGLLKVYKDRKAKGEKMDNLSAKTWWFKCPASVRQAVHKMIK